MTKAGGVRESCEFVFVATNVPDQVVKIPKSSLKTFKATMSKEISRRLALTTAEQLVNDSHQCQGVRLLGASISTFARNQQQIIHNQLVQVQAEQSEQKSDIMELQRKQRAHEKELQVVKCVLRRVESASLLARTWRSASFRRSRRTAHPSWWTRMTCAPFASSPYRGMRIMGCCAK